MIFSRANKGDLKNSSREISKPSQIAYSVLTFTELLLFFLIDVKVDCGTPLALKSSYLVLFCSKQSYSILKITASPSFMAHSLYYGQYSRIICQNSAKFSIFEGKNHLFAKFTADPSHAKDPPEIMPAKRKKQIRSYW